MERMTPEQAAVVGQAERRQMSKLEAQVTAAQDLALRQWCADKAVSILVAAGMAQAGLPSPAAYAQDLYTFITGEWTKKEQP